jgi:hypothetical protein
VQAAMIVLLLSLNRRHFGLRAQGVVLAAE